MSERGSFVTEYIYCRDCFEAAKTVLIEKGRLLCSTAIPHWSPNQVEGKYLPIIAGKINHTWSEAYFIENELGPELPVECWNDAPIDLDRAHQATLDLCRGGK